MKISFILPVHNAQATIANTIVSLLDQRHVEKEIIVINDGSTDYTHRIIKGFADKITYIDRKSKRGGAALCRNIGNDIATGQIIAVCDADHYYKDRATAINQFFKKYKDMSVFYSALHLQESRHIFTPSLMEAHEWDFKSKCPLSHPTIAYRSNVALNCPYPEESTETDLYEFMLLDAHKKGYKFGWVQNPLMLKYEGNSTRDVSGAKELKKKKYKEWGITI